ncbi:pyrimidine 5'-nucleotidase [Yunchengibacter salinarum]|uniref:pyrimidine 5'-nucleotidase n=1 Tax=Yunchengibacter salinarum TaxID=3133399 RepID=UPI0035B63B44
MPHTAPRPATELDRDVWVFDLDNTLYSADTDLFSQVDRNIGDYVADLTGLPAGDARRLQKDYLMRYGTTLKGLMAEHGVDPEGYLERVHAIDFSPLFPDPALDRALSRLSARKLVFTNADAQYADRVLDRLGISHHFDGIFDIKGADYEPKPKDHAYDRFLDRFGVDPAKALMVEDMARNLKPAFERGMATVWVNTGSVWGEADHSPDYIMQEVPALTDWLLDHVGAPAE